MVEVMIFLSPESSILSVLVKGHAGYANKGEDIVCSAFSTLVQSLVLGLEDVLGFRNFYNVKDECEKTSSIPEIKVDRPVSSDERVEVLFSTFKVSAKKIAQDYPGYAKYTEVQKL